MSKLHYVLIYLNVYAIIIKYLENIETESGI
jgi:hypothetical protein